MQLRQSLDNLSKATTASAFGEAMEKMMGLSQQQMALNQATQQALQDGSQPGRQGRGSSGLDLQRLAAPAKVYVEQFSAHPLEADAADLYAPPAGYLDADEVFHAERQSPGDKPVYEIELRPEDGLYPMPYMALQADGTPWEEECATPGAGDEGARQGFYPDGSRSFEEIDRLSVGDDGRASLTSSVADVDFYRGLPPGGYRKIGRRHV